MAELYAGLYLVNGHTQSQYNQVTSYMLLQDAAQALAGVRVRRDRQNYASCILPGILASCHTGHTLLTLSALQTRLHLNRNQNDTIDLINVSSLERLHVHSKPSSGDKSNRQVQNCPQTNSDIVP